MRPFRLPCLLVCLLVLRPVICVGHLTAQQYYNHGCEKSDALDFKGAISEYDQGIALAPEFVEALNNRGLAKLKLNDLSGALADFDKVISLDRNRLEAYINRGDIR